MNPDNLLTTDNITDERDEEPGVDENGDHRQTRNKKYQQERRSMLMRGGNYRLIYVPKGNRNSKNSKFGGDFKYYLKEEIPFSLSYYGIYKKTEEDALTDEEIKNNCLVEAFKEYPEEYENLRHSQLSTFTKLDALTFNPLSEIIKKNITIQYISACENQVRYKNYPTKKSGYDQYGKTITICCHEDHFFPFVEKTGFKTDYIKKCTWKNGIPSKGRELNSINLVKELCKQKDIYFDEKPPEDVKEKEKRKEKLKNIPNEFPDYYVFSDKDSREVRKFDIKKYGPKPKEEVETEEPTKVDYMKTLPKNVLKNIANSLPDTGDKKLCKLKKYINGYLEAEKENSISEAELMDLGCDSNAGGKPLEDDYEKHLEELEKLPYHSRNTEGIYFADVESTTNGAHHITYIICWDRQDGSDKGQAEGIDSCKKFMNHLKKQKENKITVMCQLFAYEANFLVRELHAIINSIEPSRNKNYKTDGYVFVNRIPKRKVFVDQYPKIPMGLGHYEKMFGLEKGKFKNFPYCFYNNETAFLPTWKVKMDLYDEMSKVIPAEYLQVSLDGEHLIINSRQYALDYCHQDVKTQREGWNFMLKAVEEEFGLDYHRFVTLPSLAKGICLKEGCYEGVHELRGPSEAFIRRCCVGGRVMVALHNGESEGIRILNEEEGDEYRNGFDYNYEDDTIYPEKGWEKFGFSRFGKENIYLRKTEKKKREKLVRDSLPKSRTENKFISPRPRVNPDNYDKYYCLDANSLYPSAIVAGKGFPIGPPKNISKEELVTKSFQKTADEYFIKIKIWKFVGKYAMPLSNYTDKNGKRKWMNDMEGREVYIDRVSLELLEKYYIIEYSCKCGLMFNEGYNTKIKDVVKRIYERRLKHKAEGNRLELLDKLVINCIYGKNLQKPKGEIVKWSCGKTEDIDKIYSRYDVCAPKIIKIRPGMFKIKYKIAFDVDHWSTVHCGCLVLSQSKTIMADHSILVDDYMVYTDTDSMVINEYALEKLKREKPEMFGKGLGQFKIEQHLDGENVYIEKGIFLGKKLYCYKEVNGDTGEVYWKMAAKGIPQSTLWTVCNQKFRGDPLKMYYGMIYREGGVLFDLLDGGDRIRMNFLEELKVETVDEFSRTLGGYK